RFFASPGPLLANALTRFITRPTPFVLTATVILVAGMLAQFMSHTAATSILAPVCVALSRRLGVNPAPLLMALCQATSIAVATPIGTPPNVIVYQRGGYKFLDFVITGVPLFILSWLALSVVIPRVFPF
ncbi:MAG TPA: SLC13/DASS family transporter, partial [Firmicutes bacterium]|nr:SLC13/DASS family transporter [Bacillota bacterium]